MPDLGIQAVTAERAQLQTELAQLRGAATLAADVDLETMGNDFRANDLGGSARRRPMQAGELYILDAGTVVDGYFSDSCRTFAVDGSPTDAQMRAWEHLDRLFPILEAAAVPGLDGAALLAEPVCFSLVPMYSFE